jgi:hypothetical protein
MGPWRRATLGFSGGALITAVVSRWGTKADSWIILGAGLLFIGTLLDGLRPKVRAWRARRREDGYLKIVGGYKTVNRREIRYADGTQDVDIQGKGAAGIALTPHAAGACSMPPPSTRWEQIKRRFRRG